MRARPGGNAATVVAMMVAVALLNATDAVIVRLLAGEVHPFIIAFFRSLFGLLAMLPWILARRDLGASPFRWLHLVRAALKLASLIAFFVAFARAPLPDVTAINFSMPIFMLIGGWAFLDERLSGARLAAIVCGLIGMMIVIRPGGAGFDPALVYALGGAVLTAIMQLMLRPMSQRDAADRLVAWNLVCMSGLGLVLAVAVWRTPTPAELALLLLQGTLGVVNQTLVTRSLALSDAGFVAPLDYLRLPAVALLAYLAFGEVAAVTTFVGAALIFAGTLVALAGARLRPPAAATDADLTDAPPLGSADGAGQAGRDAANEALPARK